MFKMPYFDNAEADMFEDADRSEEGAPALAAFLALTSADRIADSRHVFAYYKDYHQAVGGEDWLDEQMGIPEALADIWNYVTPGSEIDVQKGRHGDENWYVIMEANCGWEEEHGLMLVWRNGTVLTKVGGYDGHFTNVNSYADDTLVDVVYAASNPEFTTRLNELG